MLSGGLVGLGAWCVVRALSPQPASLTRDLAELRRPRWNDQSTAPPGWSTRVRMLAVRVASSGATEQLRADLALVERSEERLAVERCACALVFAALPLLFDGIVTIGAVGLSPMLVVVTALGLGVVGYFVPLVGVRSEASKRRRASRVALGAYLDVVSILLAGGKGPTSALADAATAGSGWLFSQLDRTLRHAAATGRQPWDELARLAERLALGDLYEFASSMTLAGTAGAGVRETLLAKADTLRVKALAEAEASAQHDSELLVIPTVALLVAFILLLGFPAAYQITGF
jgi:Flp pilus assembly protein TadB